MRPRAFLPIRRESFSKRAISWIAERLSIPYCRAGYGLPAEAIARPAQEGGFELIIVGARGHGMSKALFGSVTAKLIGGTRVAVFVGPSVSSQLINEARTETAGRRPGRRTA